MAPTTRSFDDPLRVLRESHRQIERSLAILSGITEASQRAALTGPDRQEFGAALRCFRIGAPAHTADEEESLFLLLRRSSHPDLVNLRRRLDTLEEEHRCADRSHALVDRLGRYWLQARLLEAGQRSQLLSLLAGLTVLYRRHIQFEEETVFPLAFSVLGRYDLEVLADEMASRRAQDPAPTQ